METIYRQYTNQDKSSNQFKSPTFLTFFCGCLFFRTIKSPGWPWHGPPAEVPCFNWEESVQIVQTKLKGCHWVIDCINIINWCRYFRHQLDCLFERQIHLPCLDLGKALCPKCNLVLAILPRCSFKDFCAIGTAWSSQRGKPMGQRATETYDFLADCHQNQGIPWNSLQRNDLFCLKQILWMVATCWK